MTPFEETTERTATISLNTQEQELVRREPNFHDIYEVVLAIGIIVKLRESLKVSDALRGPVGHSIKSEEVILHLDLLK